MPFVYIIKEIIVIHLEKAACENYFYIFEICRLIQYILLIFPYTLIHYAACRLNAILDRIFIGCNDIYSSQYDPCIMLYQDETMKTLKLLWMLPKFSSKLILLIVITCYHYILPRSYWMHYALHVDWYIKYAREYPWVILTTVFFTGIQKSQQNLSSK